MKTQIIISAVFINAIFVANTVFADDPPDYPHWNYGNQNWGGIENMDETEAPLMYPYALCSLGERQTPINLAGARGAKRFNKLQFKYIADQPVFYNAGYAVQVQTSSGYKGVLKISDDAYPLIEYHFHAPSEHVIGDKRFPAELHFVHVRKDGRIAVLGVFLEVGDANPIIQTILDNMPNNSKERNQNTGILINPERLLPRHINRIYTYAGSLTTPPCAEGVHWYVLDEPIMLSAAQLSQLKSFYDGNAREVQELKDREVTESSPFVHFDTPFQIFH